MTARQKLEQCKAPLTIAEVAELLGVSCDTIRREQHKIGYHKVRGMILFEPDHVIAWWDARFIPPTAGRKPR